MAVSAALVGALAPSVVTAQDECAATTPEENMAIVESYVAAVASGDMEAIAGHLHDDFTHNLSNDAIEVGVADIDPALAGDVEFEIVDMFAAGDRVAVEFWYDVHPDNVAGSTAMDPVRTTAVALLTIECGQIGDAVLESDHLEMLQSHGYEIDPAA